MTEVAEALGWKDPTLPKRGWGCELVEDIETPEFVCEMCGYRWIRYVHHMTHAAADGVRCGCCCAGRLEGDLDKAKARERPLRLAARNRGEWFDRYAIDWSRWHVSQNGNRYLKIPRHDLFAVIFPVGDRCNAMLQIGDRKYFASDVGRTFDTLDDARRGIVAAILTAVFPKQRQTPESQAA